MSYYFAIVGTKDNPVYEVEFGSSGTKSASLDPYTKVIPFAIEKYLILC
jgi:hypothetical protein